MPSPICPSALGRGQTGRTAWVKLGANSLGASWDLGPAHHHLRLDPLPGQPLGPSPPTQNWRGRLGHFDSRGA